MLRLADIELHAPKVHILIKKYYKRINGFIKFLNDNSYDYKYLIEGNKLKEIIEEATNFFGILPYDSSEYNKSLLNNDDFRLSVIIHLAITNLIGEELDWESFLFHKKFLYKVCECINNENYGVETFLLKILDVDPNALSSSFIIRNNKIDEFNKASDIILFSLKYIKYFNKNDFADYDDYYDYVKERASKTISLLHNKGYFGTRPIDIFTCTCISYKMRIPVTDILYRYGPKPDIDMPLRQTKLMQEEILNKIFN